MEGAYIKERIGLTKLAFMKKKGLLTSRNMNIVVKKKLIKKHLYGAAEKLER